MTIQKCLSKIYNTHFMNEIDIKKYLSILYINIKKEFSKNEIDYFIKYANSKYDLIALEYSLRKKNRKNIFSFIFLRLSSLAETLPQNQHLYVNKKNVGILKIFIFLIKTLINLININIKSFFLQKIINEYQNI